MNPRDILLIVALTWATVFVLNRLFRLAGPLLAPYATNDPDIQGPVLRGDSAAPDRILRTSGYDVREGPR